MRPLFELEQLLAPCRQRSGTKHLADRLEHHVGGEREALAGAGEPARSSSRVYSNSTPVTWPLAAEQPHRPRPMLDLHAVDLRELLLVLAGAHLLRAAAIDDGHVLGAEPLRLHGDVDRGHAAADHHDAPADRQRRQVRGLAQPRDVGDRVLDAGQILALGTPSAFTPARPMPRNTAS